MAVFFIYLFIYFFGSETLRKKIIKKIKIKIWLSYDIDIVIRF